MADYDIFVLGESDVIIDGGAGQLDGVTQGDGSHLLGLTIVFSSNAFVPISITDNNNTFQDNGNQRLVGDQTIDGVTYTDGTRVEAEYGFVVTDGTNSWTLVGFNVANSSPVFGTVEGVAVIGGPGDFPPAGVTLTVTDTFENPQFESEEFATPICLTAGTQVQTRRGMVAIERITSGDLVLTRDNGLQPVRWIGQRRVVAKGSFAPVEIAAGALGNHEALLVSQQHRVLLEGWRSELISGQPQTLAAAVHLVNDHSIRLKPGGMVTYVHLLFDRHEIILTNGHWTESLFPGGTALTGLLPHARAELFALYPELSDIDSTAVPLSYPQLTRHEAAVLAGL